MTRTVKQIGVIGVDAGLCWIGDPCYILHRDKLPSAIGSSWADFCRILREGNGAATLKQFNFDQGHPGLGVAVETGYGDGLYPVYAEFNEKGRVCGVLVEFIGGEDRGVA